jgi:hypothetical protein
MPLDEGRMHGFVAALLAESGGLAEPIEPDGLEVLAPPDLQRALGVGEFSRFGFGASLPDGAQRVGIESDWLSRFGRVVGDRGRWSRRVLVPPARKPPDSEALLERELLLDNATFRLLNVTPAWTRYLVLDFRYTALSDEKREGTQRLALNLATGAMPDGMAARLASELDENNGETLPADAALPADWERARVIDRARRALPWRVQASLTPFVTGLRRRLARDLDRLHGYHNDLHREAAERSAQAPANDAARQREGLRMAAIAQEYRAKLDDLTHKYALRISAEWVQTMEVVTPVHRLTVQIRRRKAERVLTLDWNLLTRHLEAPPCEATLSTERPRLVCDDALHLVSPAGLAACPGCGRPYCRACNPERCAKCGHPDLLNAFG